MRWSRGVDEQQFKPYEGPFAADLPRRFHNSGCGCMVATRSLEQDLRDRGLPI